MDFTETIKSFHQRACILAVESTGEGERDKITVVAANEEYLISVNKQNEPFVPGRPYTYYIEPDRNFEIMCGRCSSKQKAQHQYVNAELYKAWLDLYMIPLESDDDNVKYCLFSYDMTPQPESAKLLDISESTAMQVLKTCIRLRKTDDFQAAMDSIIKDIRKMCDSSACSILLTDFDERKCKILCVDHDDSFSMDRDDIVFMDEFIYVAETWRDLMAGSNCYIIADENDMKIVEEKDPEWAKTLRISGIYNVVLYPLRIKNKILGYIWATNFNADKIQNIKEVMELNAFLLAAEIANHQMFEKMNFMSRYDILTGVMNRNAMNTRVEESKSGKNPLTEDFGVVFVDLNGLKRINDCKGHTAGDEMIKSVASKLRDIFDGYEIYRAGGDEFMILAEGCPKNKFDYMVGKLKEQDLDTEAARFAVGSYYDDGDHDIKAALRAADTDMYNDKSSFYHKHPEMSRRSG
ncbi:MAG: sensor domain-containing diguanylate cyclase [Lachnospiraceae bacterium]|nr:sensor domain-containing diguanylate cyclase [Lachnospiraceae bacterium]